MSTPKMPSLDLVRQLTDQHVLGRLIEEPELTRAELAGRTGISKPTVSESVRRLVAAGLLVESGKQSGKRGPSGTFYRLRSDAGYALTLTISPGGVIAETSDLRGDRLRCAEGDVPGPVSGAELEPVLARLVADAVHDLPGGPISAAVNVAGPVDQRSQRLVRLPNSPYFLDDFDPAGTLRDRIAGPVQIDNDVNWAAAAEHTEGRGRDLDDFLYAYLGPGIGSAIYAGGMLIRGHRGLAGELANVRTEGPGGRTRRLADCFAGWHLRTVGTEAIDVDRVDAVLADRSDPRGDEIVRAVATALASLAAALDPEVILVGGPWATSGGLDQRITAAVEADNATTATVHRAELGPEAAHRGARTRAVADARQQLLQQIS